MSSDDWALSARTILVLIAVFGALVCVVYLWSTVDMPLTPSEGITEQLGKAFQALVADPTRSIREGRAKYIECFLILITFAVAVKITQLALAKVWNRPVSPFDTSLPFVLFTIAATIFTFALEAGASAYGWYNYFAIYEPYRTMFTGQIVPGIRIDASPPYWGGSPFDSITHICAGVVVGSYLLNFGVVHWFKIKPHWKGIIIVAITTTLLIGYEFLAPQPPVEFWNTVLDILHDFSGACIAVFAYTYLAPEQWAMT
jgi:hypothetical protein